MILRTHRRTSALAGLALSTALLLGACSTADSTASDTSTGADQGTAAVAGGPVADLDFTGERLDGESFRGEELAGKPTVLWFWAPWCSTCRAQAPGVQALAEEYDGRVNVVGVGGLDDTSAIVDYASGLEGPLHLIDPDGAIWRHFGVRAQSSYLVIDADGQVRENGYLDDQVLADLVSDLVA